MDLQSALQDSKIWLQKMAWNFMVHGPKIPKSAKTPPIPNKMPSSELKVSNCSSCQMIDTVFLL